MTAGSGRAPGGRTAPSSERTPSSMSGEVPFSKTLSSADAFTDVVPETLPFESLAEMVALLEKSNLVLRLENKVFQDKLAREDPELLCGLSAILEEEASRKSSSSTAESLAAASDGRGDDGAHVPVAPAATPVHSPSRTTTLSRSEDTAAARSRIALSTAASDTASDGHPRPAGLRPQASGHASKTGSLDRVPRMSFGQRVDLAEEAALVAAERARAARLRAEAVAADLRAEADEAHARLAETRAARQALEDGVAGSGDPATGRASADKFLRYMTDLAKQADAAVDRLRLKVSALRGHRRRVRADIDAKQVRGDALRPVDFDKIRIEIDEYNRKIVSKNRHLVDLKNISGSATSRLLASKKRLSDLVKQLDAIHRETATRRRQIAALESEELKVLQDVGRADQALNAIRVRMDKYEAPDVLAYVRLKEHLDVLRRDCTVWERRCKIQTQTTRDLRRAKGRQLSARVDVVEGRADVQESDADPVHSTSSDGDAGAGRGAFRTAAARPATASVATRGRRARRRRSAGAARAPRPRSSSTSSGGATEAETEAFPSSHSSAEG